MQPGPPIIYTCDVSIKCSAIISLNKVLQTQPSMQQSKILVAWKNPDNRHNTKSSNTNNSKSTKRTPKYPVVQHCCLTTSLFLFVCLVIAIGNRQGHFRDELLMGEKTSHKEIGNEHKCAHLYILVRKKSSSPAIDSLKNINTKHDLKNFHHEQNTLPNAPLKMTIRANVRISFFLSERRVPVLRLTH